MPTRLEDLVKVRSRLVEEVLAYLDTLAERLAELPSYYPIHLRTNGTEKTRFDDVRHFNDVHQMVQVVVEN